LEIQVVDTYLISWVRPEAMSVGPGEGFVIEGWLDTPSAAGNVDATISLKTNEDKKPEVILTARAEVKLPPAVSPARLDFGKINEDVLPVTKFVEISSNGVAAQELASTLCLVSSEDFVKTTEFSVEGNVLRCGVILTEDIPAGYIDARLQLQESGRKTREIPLHVDVCGDLEVYPPWYFLVSCEADKKLSQTIHVTGIGRGARVDVVPPTFDIASKECFEIREEDGDITLILDPQKGFSREGIYDGHLGVTQLSDDGQPVGRPVRVPLRVVVKRDTKGTSGAAG